VNNTNNLGNITNIINSNVNYNSPQKNKRENYTNSNLAKFLNNASSNNNNDDKGNHAFLPTLDDILNNDNNQQNSERNSKLDNASNLRSVDKSYEPSSLMSHNQKFPTDMSTYSHKFLSVSKNLSKYFNLDIFYF